MICVSHKLAIKVKLEERLSSKSIAVCLSEERSAVETKDSKKYLFIPVLYKLTTSVSSIPKDRWMV